MTGAEERVLYTSSSLPPGRIALFTKSLDAGGAERVMLNLATAILERGHPIDIVLCKTGGALTRFVPDRARVVDLGGRRVARSVLPLARYLRRERPSAMISALDHTNLAAVWARSWSRVEIPLVLSAHNVASAQFARRSPVERAVMRRLIRWTYPHANYVVGVAQEVVDDLIRWFDLPADRVVRVANPIVTPELLRRAREPVTHPWLAPTEPPLVLAVGRLHPQKRFDVLLEAFALLTRERQARLLILGEGSQRVELESHAARLGLGPELFALPGYIENPYSLMARAALVVLSSDYEGLPSVVIEALAVGCPVVSTDCPGGSREILEDGALGPLVPPGDSAALAAAMATVLASPPDRAMLVRRSLEYSAAIATDRYLALLLPEGRAVVSSGGRRGVG